MRTHTGQKIHRLILCIWNELDFEKSVWFLKSHVKERLGSLFFVDHGSLKIILFNSISTYKRKLHGSYFQNWLVLLLRLLGWPEGIKRLNRIIYIFYLVHPVWLPIPIALNYTPKEYVIISFSTSIELLLGCCSTLSLSGRCKSHAIVSFP